MLLLVDRSYVSWLQCVQLAVGGLVPLFQALVLGIVQGATEFVPVSSSAHLVLVPWLLGWGPPGLLFDTVVHWGTLAGVLACFWQDVLLLGGAFLRSAARRRIEGLEARWAWLIALGTLPAALMGLFWEEAFEALFASPPQVAGLLLVTGLLLYISQRLGSQSKGPQRLASFDAVFIGLAQGLAIAPGISRCGATLAAGLWRGFEMEVALRYSFLLSIPIIFGAGLSQIRSAWALASLLPQLPGLVVGFGAAALSGYVAIRFLLAYLGNHRLYPFAFYCWAVGLACIVLTWLH